MAERSKAIESFTELLCARGLKPKAYRFNLYFIFIFLTFARRLAIITRKLFRIFKLSFAEKQHTCALAEEFHYGSFDRKHFDESLHRASPHPNFDKKLQKRYTFTARLSKAANPKLR